MLIVSIPEPAKGVRKYLYGSGLTDRAPPLLPDHGGLCSNVDCKYRWRPVGGLVFHFGDLIRNANACKNL